MNSFPNGARGQVDRIPAATITWLVVLLTLSITAFASRVTADDESPAPPRKPFLAYSWSPDPEKSHDNIIPFYWLMARRDLSDPSKAKQATDVMPDGHKVLFSWDMHRDIPFHPDDFCRTADGELTKVRGIWWDKGVERAAARFDDFFRRFKQIGGHVDAIVLDMEIGLANWSMGAKPERWDAVKADPRFEEIAKELGFRDLQMVRNWRSGDDYNRWNALMHRRCAEYINTALYEPIRKHFPDVKMSNWEYYYNSPKCKCPNTNGHQFSRYSNGKHVGSHQTLHLYGAIGTLKHFVLVDDEFVRTGVGPKYTTTPFDGFRYNVNRMRTMVLSSDVPAWPWIPHRSYPDSLLANDDLYQETILHAGLCNPDAFLLWNPKAWRKNQKPEDYNSSENMDYVDRCLRELDELVGQTDRRTLVTDLENWFGSYVLTGMQAGGRNVWRLTPNVPETKVPAVVVSQVPPVFRIGDSEIRFSAGRIVERPRPVSGRGFWVTADKSVRPERVSTTTPRPE